MVFVAMREYKPRVDWYLSTSYPGPSQVSPRFSKADFCPVVLPDRDLDFHAEKPETWVRDWSLLLVGAFNGISIKSNEKTSNFFDISVISKNYYLTILRLLNIIIIHIVLTKK